MAIFVNNHVNRDNRTAKEQVDHIVNTDHEELAYMSFIDFIAEKVWMVYCDSEYNRGQEFRGETEEYDSISRIIDLVNWDDANLEIRE